MAPRHSRRRNRALVAVYDASEGYLVFRFDLTGLFSDDRPAGHTLEPLPLPRPVACFPILRRTDDMAFAASPCGTKILAVTNESRTVVYDTATSSSSPGPGLRAGTFEPVLLAAGGRRRDMLVAANNPFAVEGPPGLPHCEALHLHAGRWRALPLPPFPFAADDRCHIGGYFDASAAGGGGARVCLSMFREGTYSLDMAVGRRASWRWEGAWELPFHGRGVLVPELGGGLLFGLRYQRLCACDVRARPPALVGEWADVHPAEEELYRYPVMFSCAGMAHLGGGRFCVSWSSSPAPAAGPGHPFRGRLLALTAVEVTMCGGTGELQLRKHRSRCYHMPPGQVIGYVL